MNLCDNPIACRRMRSWLTIGRPLMTPPKPFDFWKGNELARDRGDFEEATRFFIESLVLNT